jgi:hypothetical protein
LFSSAAMGLLLLVPDLTRASLRDRPVLRTPSMLQGQAEGNQSTLHLVSALNSRSAFECPSRHEDVGRDVISTATHQQETAICSNVTAVGQLALSQSEEEGIPYVGRRQQSCGPLFP